MEQSFRRALRRRISYLPTIISITLVLFLAGLFGMFLINANKVKQEAKENVQLSIYFKDDVSEPDIMQLERRLEAEQYVKSATYVSKEAGLKSWENEMGDNPEELLGFNPFPNSIDVHFKAGFVEADSLANLKKDLEKNLAVREVTYNQVVVENIDRNVKLVGIILLSLAIIMGAVSIAMIYNTIRLTLFAKRFIIKSMQLVGATRNFIRRPFILRGFLIGFISSAIAAVMLFLTLYFLESKFEDLKLLSDNLQVAGLMAAITLLGILISSLSSFLAINKYLRMKLDDLF